MNKSIFLGTILSIFVSACATTEQETKEATKTEVVADVGVHSTCVNAPKFSTVILPEPIHNFASIKCLSNYGHLFVASEKSRWYVEGSKSDKKGWNVNIGISSIGQKKYQSDNPHLAYFSSITELPSSSQIVYGLFPKLPLTQSKQQYPIVKSFIFTSNSKNYNTLFFLIENDQLEYILDCHDTTPERLCQVATLLKVGELDSTRSVIFATSK